MVLSCKVRQVHNPVVRILSIPYLQLPPVLISNLPHCSATVTICPMATTLSPHPPHLCELEEVAHVGHKP